jgi:hypothetical protein
MTCNIKPLGLAVLAMLAIGATTASSAQGAAPEFTTEVGPWIVEGDQLIPHILTIQLGATVKCEKAHFVGTNVSKESDTIMFSPQYSECMFMGQPATATTNGCWYEFGLVAKSSPPAAKMFSECPGKPGENEIEFTSDVFECAVKFDQEVFLESTTFSNTGNGAGRSIDANFVVKKLIYEVVGAGCVLEPKVYNNGEYTGSAEFKAYKDEESVKGKQQGLWVA